jgi:4-hydroxybenzoate polyprenyltransferase
MNAKKITPICLIILGIAVTIPFNYIYGIEGPEVDLVWMVIGIMMIGFGLYLLKKRTVGRY